MSGFRPSFARVEIQPGPDEKMDTSVLESQFGSAFKISRKIIAEWGASVQNP